MMRCGEVYYCKSGTFFLDCIICRDRFEMVQFFQHFLSEHSNMESDDEALLEDTMPEDTMQEETMTEDTMPEETKDQIVKIEPDEIDESSQTPYISLYSCSACNTIFTEEKDLICHKKTNCRLECEVFNVRKQDTKAKQHTKAKQQTKSERNRIVKPSKTFVCEICGKNFNDSSNLRAHIKKHDPARKHYKCDKCDKNFVKQITLENHVKLKHLKETPFVCPVDACGRTFVNQKALEDHAAFHADRKYECSYCYKKYLRRSKLNEHVKLYHIQGKIHRCPECEKSFYDAWNLKCHMVCHSGEKPFACDECDAKFTRQKALLWHKKVHSGVMEKKIEPRSSSAFSSSYN